MEETQSDCPQTISATTDALMETAAKEVSKSRSLEEIKKEYAQCCAQLGERYFQFKMIEQETFGMLEKIRLLNVEAGKVNSEISKLKGELKEVANG